MASAAHDIPRMSATDHLQMEKQATNGASYPCSDIAVPCSELAGEAYLIKQPSVVVDAFSHSIAGGDRGNPFDAYTKLSSRQADELAHQERPCEGIFRRPADGQQDVREPDAAIPLDRSGVIMPLIQFCRRVEF